MKRPKRIRVGFLAVFFLSGWALAGSDALLESLKTSKSYDPKIWDQSVSRILEKSDATLLGVMLDSKLPGGNQAAERRFKLFEIYRKVPQFYVKTARNHWKGNLDCVVESIVPESGVISAWEVSAVAKQALTKDSSNQELKAFDNRVTEYGNSLKPRSKTGKLELSREGCELGLKKN